MENNKRPIIEIEEIGEPNSLIYRKGAQISEIVNTQKLIKELNEQLSRCSSRGRFMEDFFEYLDTLTDSEYDNKSITEHGEDWVKK